jgi:Na+/melibiose symporter-like transporter
MDETEASASKFKIGLPARLGWVSFFNDASSEVLARILPLYLTAVLHTTPAFVGVVEGLAESAAIFLKGISGWLSDRFESRKGFVLGGYGLSVTARALYLVSVSPAIIGASRVSWTGSGRD